MLLSAMQLWPGTARSKGRREPESDPGPCFGQVFIWEEKTLLLNLGSWVLDPGGPSDRRAGLGLAAGEAAGRGSAHGGPEPLCLWGRPSSLVLPLPWATALHGRLPRRVGNTYPRLLPSPCKHTMLSPSASCVGDASALPVTHHCPTSPPLLPH